jgi:16S rRNA processing protein RimM
MAAPPLPDDPSAWVTVGQVVKVHGLLGEVSVELLTDFPERFGPGAVLLTRRGGLGAGTLRVETARPHKGRLLVRFEGVAGPDAAEVLRGLDLCVALGDLPRRPEDFYFHWELEGFEVRDAAGSLLGTAGELGEAGGLPLLTVRTEGGDRDVPFRYPILVSIDRSGRTIVLDPPAGLLD